MKESMKNGTYMYKKSYDSYQCNYSELTNVPIVVIMFDNQSVKLSKDVLSRATNRKYELKFKNTSNKYELGVWI